MSSAAGRGSPVPPISASSEHPNENAPPGDARAAAAAAAPPTDGATPPAGGGGIPQNAINPIRRIFAIVGLLTTGVFCGLLAWQQVTYSKTWDDEPDFALKIWSTVWLSTVCVKSAFHSYVNTSTLWRPEVRPPPTVITLAQILLDIFLFCWTLYGIPTIFIYNKDESGGYPEIATKRWCYAGFIYQCILIFFPCVLIITCVPILVCLLRSPRISNALLPFLLGPQPPPSTNLQPTPPDVLAKIRKAKFGEVLAERVETGDAATDEPIPAAAGGVSDRDARATRSLVQAALPANLHSAVSQVFLRMSSQNVEPSAGQQFGRAGSVQTIFNGTATSGGIIDSGLHSNSITPSAPRQAPTTNPPRRVPSVRAPSCPICFVEFEPDDDVMCLPCDEIRHVYHIDCLSEWLGKSQHCPMCRANVVELITAKEGVP